MKTDEANTDVKPGIGIQAWFRRIGNAFFVRSTSVLTAGKTLTIGEVYEIHDLRKPETELIYIKLQGVYLRGFTFHIVGIDIRTGDLFMRSQRLNSPELPSNFLIRDLLLIDERIVDKIFRAFEEDLMDFDSEGIMQP